jgi:hypothetical protein
MEPGLSSNGIISRWRLPGRLRETIIDRIFALTSIQPATTPKS